MVGPVSAAPRLGAFSPPPVLWLSHPRGGRAPNSHAKLLCGVTRAVATNDRFLSTPYKVPSMIAALTAKPALVGGDDDSLSTTSWKDSDSLTEASSCRGQSWKQPRHRGGASIQKILLPVGKPLRAKPVLARPCLPRFHVKKGIATTRKAPVPLKPLLAKTSLKMRNKLSSDERLFLEAAASLAQAAAPRQVAL
jgi:hypothetical protein